MQQVWVKEKSVLLCLKIDFVFYPAVAEVFGKYSENKDVDVCVCVWERERERERGRFGFFV